MTSRVARLLAGASTVLFASAALSQPAPAPATPADDPVNDASINATQAGESATTQSASEDGSQTGAEQGSRAALEDLVVTAQRRRQRAQDVPISLTVISQKELQKRDIKGVEDLGRASSSLYFGVQNEARPLLYVRGIGSRNFDPGTEQSVGVFKDDLYVARSSAIIGALSDVGRVEVLHGPQGTLYGRNTIAGAISFFSSQPTEQLEGMAQVGVGSRNLREFLGVVSGPLSGEALMARAVVFGTYQNGYIRNLTTGHALGGVGRTGGRLSFLSRPTERVTLSIIGDLIRDNARAGPQKTQVIEGDLATRVQSSPLLATIHPSRFAEYYNSEGRRRRTIAMLTGKAEYTGDDVVLTSITGYQYNKFTDAFDFDASPLRVITQNSEERGKAFSQEFRFSSNPQGRLSLGGRLNWVGGLFYFNDRPTRYEEFAFGPDSNAVIRQNGAAVTNVFDLSWRTKSYAAFGQATLTVLPGLDLTAGARYTKDKKSNSVNASGAAAQSFLPTNYVVEDLRASWSSFDPRIAVSYKLSPDLLLYGSWATGFKSGGFQFLAGAINTAGATFDPEEATTFEVGTKTQWFDRRLTANLALWKTSYEGLQVSRRAVLPDGTLAQFVSNAGSSKLRGADVSLAARPTRDLDLSISYSYLFAEYKDFVFSALPPVVDYSGSRMVRAPKHTLNAMVSYGIDVTSAARLTLMVEESFRSKFYFDLGEARFPATPYIPYTVQRAHSLTNLRASLEFARAWEVEAYVTNVFNKYYLSSVQLAANQVKNSPGEPRTFGLRTTFRF